MYINVVKNIPKKALVLSSLDPIPGGWLAFIISKQNKAYHNWIHENDSYIDISPPDLRFIRKEKTNRVYDNQVIEVDTPENWPSDAIEVMDKAGLTEEYQYIKNI